MDNQPSHCTDFFDPVTQRLSMTETQAKPLTLSLSEQDSQSVRTISTALLFPHLCECQWVFMSQCSTVTWQWQCYNPQNPNSRPSRSHCLDHQCSCLA